jgi:hypothetical protein
MDQYYELHVTIEPKHILLFAEFCAATKVKPLYIQLDKGIHRNQPMIAVTKMLPDDRTAIAWAKVYESYITPHFRVHRTKLESRLVEGPNEYYEAHWKIAFDQNPLYWERTLRDLNHTYPELLLSQNLFDTRIHYLSQRIYGSCNPVQANEVFTASGNIIKDIYGLPMVKTHYERCVWDSNPALDFGWA